MTATAETATATTAPPPSEVQAILRRAGPGLAARMTHTEERLAAITGEAAAPLAAYASATVVAGGKRLRPLLVFLAAESARTAQPAVAQDCDEAPLLRAAVAVELVHSATLVHDDILDAANLRRGHPTVVAAAGRETAVATGDLLFSRAFAELALNRSEAQLRALSDASSALAAGELLQREDAYVASVTLERYLHRCRLKTAYLFEAACRLGALAGRTDPPVVRASGLTLRADARTSRADANDGAAATLARSLGDYARAIGLAFQLLDDILDVSGPASRTGKHRGTDLLDGTVTLPLILARERDSELAALDLHGLAGPAAAEEVCDRIAATGALEESRQRALEIVAAAKAELPAGLADDQRDLLELLADALVERFS